MKVDVNSIVLLLLVVAVFIVAASVFSGTGNKREVLTYSDVLQYLEDGEVVSFEVSSKDVMTLQLRTYDKENKPVMKDGKYVTKAVTYRLSGYFQ
ncbi:MAG: ATP-dependent metallopeptidase FtsH/Yme1/Tma family protein, partial [Clostridia bacterium]|nr:ATP-dependent metallopeptidase FtsH/Yme1/Tma family protein [Clostridia bacterium]